LGKTQVMFGFGDVSQSTVIYWASTKYQVLCRELETSLVCRSVPILFSTLSWDSQMIPWMWNWYGSTEFVFPLMSWSN
jgi:hypothetical protein